jgi:putative drug exporter of the RND superfamily
MMLTLADWCMRHRRRVLVAWVAVAIVTTALAAALGSRYATNFTLPGTESQRASDLLTHEFGSQSGDVDTIVVRVSHGTIDAAPVRAAITPLLARVSTLPHVAGIISPYSPGGPRAGVARTDDRVRDDRL